MSSLIRQPSAGGKGFLLWSRYFSVVVLNILVVPSASAEIRIAQTDPKNVMPLSSSKSCLEGTVCTTSECKNEMASHQSPSKSRIYFRQVAKRRLLIKFRITSTVKSKWSTHSPSTAGMTPVHLPPT